MNRIANSGNNVALAQDLQDIISEISVYATQAQADVIMRQLIGESLVNVAAVAATTVLKSQGVVFNRLDRIREIELDTLTPPAAGTGVEPNRVWAGGFGVWTEADNRNHVYGYDYSGGGVALGYDRKVDAAPGLRVGVSMAYAAGEMRGKDSRTHVDTSTIGFGAYGSYLLPNNVFFDANVGYANTGNEYDIDLYPSGKKTGEFTIHSWQFGVRGGAVIQANNVQVIPSIGVRYLHYKQEGFRDTIRSNDWPSSVANHYARKTEDQWDIPLQVKVNGTFNTGPAIITPELRLGYTFAAKKPDYAMNVGFVGSDDTARIVGARAYGNSFQAGTGVKVNTGGPFDAFVNYDLDVTDGYRTHKASAGVGVEF
jgi:outer membrane autotransporter protein